MINVYIDVRWLKAASVQLLPDNQAIFISCSVTESTPPVECVTRLNCSTCKEDISAVFTNYTLLPVIADTDYQISIQVIKEDTGIALEDYNIVHTLLVLKPTHQSSITTSHQANSQTLCKFIVCMII